MQDADESLSMSEMVSRTGVSAHTLRYYERAGLLVGVPRTPAGRRAYGPKQLESVEFITRLRGTGMPISQVLAYARLVRAGDGTKRQRLDILRAHHRAVRSALDQQRHHLDVIEVKIELYEADLAQDAG